MTIATGSGAQAGYVPKQLFGDLKAGAGKAQGKAMAAKAGAAAGVSVKVLNQGRASGGDSGLVQKIGDKDVVDLSKEAMQMLMERHMLEAAAASISVTQQVDQSRIVADFAG